MSAVIDIEEVRHALTAQRVLDYYQVPTRRGGRDELESKVCPRRADHPRRAFTINLTSGQWRCWPCGIGGDPIRLVAEFEHLSDRDNFPEVLTRAAEIAGVGPSELPPADRAARRDRLRREREQRIAADKQRRADQAKAAVPMATQYWEDLDRRDPRGEEYLRQRGVLGALDLGLVRFDNGSPAIALHTRAGEIRNVVRRRLPELGEPKTPGLLACPTAGTLIGSIASIGSDVVVAEGVADTLTAVLAWPGATVLGAHGAGNITTIVRAAAPLIAKSGRRLLLVPHNDSAGKEACIVAGHAAVELGLSQKRGSLVVVKHGEKDLNDAWRRGWRP